MQVSRRVAFAVLALLSLQFLVLGLVQAWRDSPTYDEKYHLSGGVTALTEHQLRLTPEHPPLPKVLAALPVLAMHPEIPHGRSWARGDSFTYPDEFLQAQLDAGKLQDPWNRPYVYDPSQMSPTGMPLIYSQGANPGQSQPIRNW